MSFSNVAAIVNTLAAEYAAATTPDAVAAVADRAMSYRSGLNTRERGILADAYLAADARVGSAPIRPLVSIG